MLTAALRLTGAPLSAARRPRKAETSGWGMVGAGSVAATGARGVHDVSDAAIPLVPKSRGALGERIVGAGAKVVLRAGLLVSPRPGMMMLRKVFAAGGAQTAAGLERYAPAPASIVSLIDERYGSDADAVLDVFRPASARGALPTLMWVHGGGFLGGSKEELSGYFKLVASHGYTVVAPRYSLAPEHHYPTPTRQMMQALQYLQDNARHLQIDPNRVAIGGDSAGAQIAASGRGARDDTGLCRCRGCRPELNSAQLRGLVLACGQYEVQLASDVSTALGRQYFHTSLWGYSGKRRFLSDPLFSTFGVAEHVTLAFPPTSTVGNADPLRPHSELLAEKLRAQGADPETLFFPAEHDPPLDHEYQFNLDTDAGQLFLRRMLVFLQACLREP